jgi:hypothetical protein
MQDHHNDLPTFLRYHENDVFHVTSDNVGPEDREEVVQAQKMGWKRICMRRFFVSCALVF